MVRFGERGLLSNVTILDEEACRDVDGESKVRREGRHLGSRYHYYQRLMKIGVSDDEKERALVSIQDPIQIGERSEPQPDLALLRPRPDFYAQTHPGPKDVLLMVEVAETSVYSDREVKIPLYARAGIPETWLVDLQEEMIEVYRKPSPQGYGQVRRARRSQRVALEAFPDLELSVDDVLG